MFRKVDLSKSAKLDMDSEFEVVDALSLLRSKPLSDLLAVATAFGMNVNAQQTRLSTTCSSLLRRAQKRLSKRLTTLWLTLKPRSERL